MKRLAVILGLSIICLNINIWAGEETSDFSGTWIPDVKKSDAAPRFIMPVGNSPVGDVSRGSGGGMGMGGGMGGFGGGGMGGPGGMPGGMGGPGGKAPQPAPPSPMVIEQSESEIRITSKMRGMDGKEMPLVESYKLDGKELVEMVPAPFSKETVKKTTNIKLKKNKLQVKVQTQNTPPMQGSSEMEKDFSLSKDGKTLTVEISNSGMMRSIQKLVYNKQ